MGLKKIDAKIRVKRSTISGVIPVVGTLTGSNDYTDGSWSGTNFIYPSEMFHQLSDEKLYIGGLTATTEIALIKNGYTGFTGSFNGGVGEVVEVVNGIIVSVT